MLSVIVSTPDHLRVSIIHNFFSYKFLTFSLVLLSCEYFWTVFWTFWVLPNKSLDPIKISNLAHFVFAVRSAWLEADHKFRPASCRLWFPHEISFHSLHSVIWIHLTLACPWVHSLTLAMVCTMFQCCEREWAHISSSRVSLEHHTKLHGDLFLDLLLIPYTLCLQRPPSLLLWLWSGGCSPRTLLSISGGYITLGHSEDCSSFCWNKIK